MKNYLHILLLLCVYVTTEAQTISFVQAPGSPITNSSSQQGHASKDLNNDGFVDLVIGNAYSNYLYIYLGTGTGQFNSAAGSPITTQSGPIYSAIADFNNDNIPDIATANYGATSVSILLGTGTGSFNITASSPITTGAYPYSIAASDVNLDGNMDLVTCNTNGNSVFVLMGNGTGSFSVAAGSPINAGGGPYDVKVAFLNSDNFPDFVIANGNSSLNTVSVFFGIGTGSFSTATTYTVGTQPRTIAIGDFNGDGFSDMATANALSNDVSVLLGSSTGVFTAAAGSPITVASYPYSIVTADFDLNGIQDLAVTNGSANGVTVLFGNGNGTFTNATGSPISVGNAPHPMVTDDFNGDGQADLAIGDWNGNQINVLINETQPTCNILSSFTYSVSGSGIVNFTSTSTGTIQATAYSWIFGDGSPASTIASPSHTYSSPGTYTVSLAVSNSFTPVCRNTSLQVITIGDVNNVGLQEILNNRSITVSPNPTSGPLVVNISGLLAKTDFVLYNVLGQEAFKTNLSLDTNQLDLEPFKNGVYYYHISENGALIKTGQIILNK